MDRSYFDLIGQQRLQLGTPWSGQLIDGQHLIRPASTA
jgi:hypothetical protein